MTARSRSFIAIGLATAVLGTALLWAAPASLNTVLPHPAAHRIHVRVWEAGAVAPSVAVNVPLVLVTATLRIASVSGLLDRSLDCARKKAMAGSDPDDSLPVNMRGRDIVALWTALVGSGPADLVNIDDGEGGQVSIRID